MRSTLNLLIAKKAHEERRRITLRTVAKDTQLNKTTLYAMANDTIERYPKDMLVKLCAYFNCEVGDLLKLEEAEIENENSRT